MASQEAQVMMDDWLMKVQDRREGKRDRVQYM